jgi:hypothetical protein
MSVAMKITRHTHKRVTTDHQVIITGLDLIDLVNADARVNGVDLVIPVDAKVTVWVPGCGDWSSTELDIDQHCPVTIAWQVVETSTEKD